MAYLSERDSVVESYERNERVNELATQVAQAEAELEAVQRSLGNLIMAVGEEQAMTTIQHATDTVAMYRLAHGEALTEANSASKVVSLREAWPTLSKQDKRTILLGVIQRIDVVPLKKMPGASLAERVSIIDKHNVLVTHSEAVLA